MFNIIPLVLILLSLGVIFVIVIRKFSVLANLDIDTIQAEKEARFKEEIISNRIKKNFLKLNTRIARIAKPAGVGISSSFKWSHEKLLEIKDKYKKEKLKNTLEQESNIDKMFLEIDECMKKDDYECAEKNYIEIIGIDPRNIKAFRGLGDLYTDKKDYEEAIQTYSHVLKLIDDMEDEVLSSEIKEGDVTQKELDAQRSEVHYELALLQKDNTNIDDAFINIKKATKIEPNNPRYLDILSEISIIVKDKIVALEAYEKLTEVNPENNKLAEIKQKIDELDK